MHEFLNTRLHCPSVIDTLGLGEVLELVFDL